MTRALIQPPRGTPAPTTARGHSARRLEPGRPQTVRRRDPAAVAQPGCGATLPLGYGLLIAAAAAVGMWAGLAKLVLMLLR